jgi:hypothetical protein
MTLVPAGRSRMAWLAVAALLAVPAARADLITDWNVRAVEIVASSGLPAPPACRVMAIVQTAVDDAVRSVASGAAEPPAVAAAVAAANRHALVQLVPSRKQATERAYRDALSAIPAGPARDRGLAAGERAAAAVLASRVDDGASLPEAYRPSAAPGLYVPTTLPLTPQWPGRKPWVMRDAAQFRPGPPPALTSERWTRDYEEIRALGSRNSARRTAEQTEIARFWEATGPGIYFPLVRSLAEAPSRDLARNASLLAAAAQAMDDALISVMDAKYAYRFWRPITAIRNGDQDGNPATERDSTWTPFIDTPMHPEYPCAHCIVAGAVGAVLEAEAGGRPLPALSTTSPAVPGRPRRWRTVGDFTREVENARIYDGVHYRHSTEVGTAMGRRIGALAADRRLALR